MRRNTNPHRLRGKVTASMLSPQTKVHGTERTVADMEPISGAVQDLRDRTVGQNYALNILMLEAAQETMAGMLDFVRLAAQVMTPMRLFAIPNAPFRVS